MSREPVVLSWSGGKDSSIALAALRADPHHEVVALVTTITRGYDRVSIHGVRRALLEAQAAAIDLPLLEVTLEKQSSNEAYEQAFSEALGRVRMQYSAVRRIVFGDLFLADVREYRERLVAESGFDAYFPLWGRDTRRLAQDFIDAGFRAHLVCVDTQQIDARLAGREFDAGLLADLPPDADPCGERGEFHTFVSAGPIFDSPIPVRPGERVLRENRFMYCDLVPDEDSINNDSEQK